MDPFDQMRIFCRVAELKSFASAARQLELSAPTVTRAVASLETRIHSQLLQRTTRGVALTAAGVQYLADSQRILRELDEAEASATGVHRSIRGELVIAAPFLYGQDVVMPLLLQFLAAHPEVQARAQLLDRPVHLYDEGIDVAFVMGEQLDSSLVALPIGHIARLLVASPAYLATFGTPTQPADLSQHCLIQSLADSRSASWRFSEPDGGNVEHAIMPRLQTSTNNAAKQAALQGFGITRLMRYQCQQQLADGVLVPVLTDWMPPPLPVYLSYREGRKASARVRSFVDFALATLRQPSV